jgi:protein MpaA
VVVPVAAMAIAGVSCRSGSRSRPTTAAVRAPRPPATRAPEEPSTTQPRPVPARPAASAISVLGRPIVVVERGDPTAPRKVVVVGAIHGNETAGIAVARLLENVTPPAGVDLFVIEDLNPDGVAAGTRQNARGVDLNRNFPDRWMPLGHRGDQQYSGPGALSEPESRLAYELIARVQPGLTIWFHQPLALVDDSGGDARLPRRYAAVVGLPFRRLPRYPGSAASWQNDSIPHSTAFVVELPPGPLKTDAARRYADGVVALSTP